MKTKKSLIFIWLLTLFITCGVQPALCAPDQPADGKKALVIVMDYIDVNDLMQAHIPNLNLLLEQSGIGLMNVRAKNRDPASSFMSMTVGSRISAFSGSELSFNSSEKVEKLPDVYSSQPDSPSAGQLYRLFTGNPAPPQGVVNLSIEPARKFADSFSPPYQIGRLGSWARESNLQIGVLGNADIINSMDRTIAILGMDNKGIVPRGDVSQDILEKDPGSLGGLSTNPGAFLAAFSELWKQSDMMFVDLGDTSRVERSRDNCAPEMLIQHRRQALESSDLLLGQILKQVDLSQTLLLILTPDTNQDMVLAGNFGLTPVIARFPHATRGLVTSPTTRRAGLVTNLDLLPTIQAYFQSPEANPTLGITVDADSHSSLQGINNQLALFLKLRKSRDPLHFTFMFILAALLVSAYLYYVRGKQEMRTLFRVLVSAGLTVPLIFLFLSYTGYASLFTTICLTLLLSLLSGFFFTLVIKNPGLRLGLLCGFTSLALIVDGFRGSPLMLLSPLGSDAIAGGRFYGIGNDYMGIILGSTLVAVMLGLNRLKVSRGWKALLGLIPLGTAALVIGYPHYGANMGGLITSLAIIALFLLQVRGRRVGIPQYVVILILAFLGTLLVAYLDARLDIAPTHAGKAVSGLSSGGLPLVWGMLQSKISILVGTTIHTTWTLILAGGVLLWLLSRSLWRPSLPLVEKALPESVQGFNVLLWGALTVFLVNDTGIIAAAFMFIYGLACLWAGLEKIEGGR